MSQFMGCAESDLGNTQPVLQNSVSKILTVRYRLKLLNRQSSR